MSGIANGMSHAYKTADTQFKRYCRYTRDLTGFV
jgi:hypothetical protein